MIQHFRVKSLFKDSAIYTLGNIIPTAGSAFLLPFYLNYLTKEEFGVVSYIQVIQSFSYIFFSLAIDRAILRIYFDSKSTEFRKELLGTAFLLILIVSLLGAFFFSTIILFLSFYGKTNVINRDLIYLAVFMAALKALLVVPRAYLQVAKRSGLFVGLSAFEFIIANLFVYYFIGVKSLGPSGMLWGLAFGSIAILPFGLSVILKNATLVLRKEKVLSLLGFSLPMVPTILSSIIIAMSDRLFLERYVSLADLGLYSIAYKISNISLLLFTGFNLAITPRYFERLSFYSYQEGVLYNKVFSRDYALIVGAGMAFLFIVLPDLNHIIFANLANN